MGYKMIVTCNECEASFKIDDSLIKDSGSKVRCSKCSSVFVVYPEAPDSAVDDADDLALEMESDLAADLDSDEELDDLGEENTADELPDLEDMMNFDDGEFAEAEMAEEASDDAELDFDLDMDADEDEIASEKDSLEDEEGLDLDKEFESLVKEDQAELSEVETTDSGLADLEMDLDDLSKVEEAEGDSEESGLDLDIDMDAEETPSPAEEPIAASTESDELDLSDLEDLVDSDEVLETEDMDVEVSDDADLDLSDLDAVLDTEEEPASEVLDFGREEEPEADEQILESAAAGDGTDELDLSDLDGIMESDEVSEAPPDGEELELDFEVEEETSAKAPAESAEISEQLEISDLEQMLKSDESPASAPEEDLDLDLDLEGIEESSVASAEQKGPDDAEFLDIEKMLEESEDAAAGTPQAEKPVELDLEAVLNETAKSDEPELELDLDMGDEMPGTESALEASEAGEADLDFKLLDSDEETLQFGATQASATIIEESQPAGSGPTASTDDFATEDFAAGSDFGGQTEVIESMGADFGAPVRRTKSRKPIFAVLALLLLCLIGYVVVQNLGIHIPYVSDLKIPYLSDVKIPYLSGLLKSEEQDIAGNLKIIPLGATITDKFVQNNAAGDIFVIQGQVRNEYDHPRSYIKITAKLYRKNKALAKTATVYCGNVLSDSDLANMDMAAINKHLQNRFGDNRSNIRVNSGKTVPFFIVFNRLPPDLDEYTVEVAGSSS